jgi:hypothetical protein
MTTRSLALAALLPLALVAACNSDSVYISSNPNAVIRFVNATNGILDASNAGVVLPDNSNLGYGGSTSCLTVSPSSPKLVIQETATAKAIVFTPRFEAGRQYTVIAYPSSTGTTQIASIDDTFRVATGQSAVNVFNGAPGSGGLVGHVTGATLGSGVAYGTAGSFTNIPSGKQAVSFTSGTTSASVLDASLTFYGGVRSTVIVTPAATGTGYRAFAVSSC